MGMTTRGRGWRRAQGRRVYKKRVSEREACGWEQSSWAGVVDTPTPCSCVWCGNPRRHFGERTRQERAADLVYEDGVACLYEDDGVWEDGVWDDLENAILWFKYSEGY